MCKMTVESSEPLPFQPFLDELERLNIEYRIDTNNKLYMRRKIPDEVADKIPMELVPEPVRRLLQEYRDGSLNKEALGAPRYHDRIKTLRRYHLISPVRRKTKTEKRAESREYLRQWRMDHSAPTVCMNSLL